MGVENTCVLLTVIPLNDLTITGPDALQLPPIPDQ